jgi:hypothetical protein
MKAFPTTYRNYDDSISHDCTGMDLRDYFAAKALQGLLTTVKDEQWLPQEVAVVCYEVADSMMKARTE